MTLDDSGSKPVRKRRSLARLVLAGIALGLAGVAIDRLVLVPATSPPLLADLQGDRGALLAARVAKRYPPGSPVATVRADLAVQGFAVSEGVAKWSRAGSPCKEFAEIGWTSSAGRIVTTRASIFQACT